MIKKKVEIGAIICLVAILVTLGMKIPASASVPIKYSTGNAVLPLFYTDTTTTTTYSVSNITDKPIDVTITLYNRDGSLLTDDNSYSLGSGKITCTDNLLNYRDNNSDSTVTFTLSQHKTSVLTALYSQQQNFGYGIVEWKQEGSTQQGLIMTGSGNSPNGSSGISINGGMPF